MLEAKPCPLPRVGQTQAVEYGVPSHLPCRLPGGRSL